MGDAAERRKRIMAALKAAFPLTVPIMAGFLFLGISYGMYMAEAGFSFIYLLVMASVIFGGSLEFAVCGMLLSPFAPAATFCISFAVQARHIFYDIAQLDKYRNAGWMKPYLIFGMCDETFSILASTDAPEGIDQRWFMFWVTLLDQLYWVGGAGIGGILGSNLPFSTEGISFVMCALFVVILLEQVMKEDDHVPVLVGVICSVASLALFGPDSFMMPALLAITAILSVRSMREPGQEGLHLHAGRLFSRSRIQGRQEQ